MKETGDEHGCRRVEEKERQHLNRGSVMSGGDRKKMKWMNFATWRARLWDVCEATGPTLGGHIKAVAVNDSDKNLNFSSESVAKKCFSSITTQEHERTCRHWSNIQ